MEEENRYLFITEDGEIFFSNSIPEETVDAVKDGIWDIIDMKNNVQYVSDGSWMPITLLDLSQFILPDDINNDNDIK